jgi:hypothetical protein
MQLTLRGEGGFEIRFLQQQKTFRKIRCNERLPATCIPLRLPSRQLKKKKKLTNNKHDTNNKAIFTLLKKYTVKKITLLKNTLFYFSYLQEPKTSWQLWWSMGKLMSSMGHLALIVSLHNIHKI